MGRKLFILLAGLGCICMTACGLSADEVVGFDESLITSAVGDLEATEKPEATKEPEVQEEEGNYFLKGNSKDLLSFEEVRFFGNDTLTLSIDSAKRILENNGMQVSIEKKEKDYNTWIVGNFPQNEGTSIMMWKYDFEEYVSSWTFVNRPETMGKTVEVGIRDIRMKDSIGEVLNKIGFRNAFEAEQELKLLVGETSIYDLPEAQRLQIEKVFDFSKIDGISVESGCGMDDELFLYIRDRAFSKNPKTEYYHLELRFVRSQETEGDYVLSQFTIDTGALLIDE